MIQILGFAVLGILLVLVGAYQYQSSVANAQRANNNCPSNASCVTVGPDTLDLYLEYLGGVLLVVAAALTVRAVWSSRASPPSRT